MASKLKFASFDGIEFPYQRCTMQGGLRDHVHEYPHTPGGNPEKMGRKLYIADFDALFLERSADPYWKNLWPTALGKLRKKFESQLTADLHIPTIGTIQAYCFDWGQTSDPNKMLLGEVAAFKFREDQSNKFLVDNIIKTSPATLGGQSSKLVKVTADAGVDPGIWDKMTAAVDDVLAVLDTIQLYSQLVESKIRYVVYLCDEADRRLDAFKDPANYLILEALKDLWASAQELLENFTSAAGNLKVYIVPVEMSTSDVAREVYEDASRGGDILSMNPIQDPFAIPAGTRLQYYKTAA